MRTVLGMLGCGLALASCGSPPELRADHAWVRLNANPRGPAAGYVTLHGGPADETLIAASYDVAIRTEMHESMSAGGLSSMRALDTVRVPARGEVAFQPGGRHLMLFDVNPSVKPGGAAPLTLTFADNQRIKVVADVVAAGDPAP